MQKNRTLKSLKLDSQNKESGLSLVELLIAITILAIAVLFSSNIYINSFRTSANMENRAKAQQIAADILAIAEQAPYKKVYTPTMPNTAELINTAGASENSDRCDPDPRTTSVNPTRFGGPMVVQPTDYSTHPSWSQYREFKGLTYCQKRYFGQAEAEQVGTTFYVQTDIIFSSLESADTPTRAEAGNPPAAENIKGKRIIVTVRWKDVHGGEDEVNKVVMQRTVLPTPSDCPLGHVTSPSASNSTNAATNGLLGC